MGAWIETLNRVLLQLGAAVAPPVGAWIETSIPVWRWARQRQSLPPWERGLKLNPITVVPFKDVAPPVGAWIETAKGTALPAAKSRRSPRGSVD